MSCFASNVLSRQLIAIQKRSLVRVLNNFGYRNLYSPAALGMDGYLRTRERIHTQFSEMGERFRKKMREFVAPESVNMVFTEDLKHMVHLAEATEEDMELIEQMIIKFNSQNKDLRFGSFVFGPVIMRMYHTLNKPKEALKIFKNPDVDGFFDQIASFQILMDLLYNNEMYDEVMEVMDIVKNKQLPGNRYPRNVVVLTFAAAYKKNTPESFQFMKEFWAELQEAGHMAMRRAVTYSAALAINQGAPHIALELLSSLSRQTYVTIRNLKVSALADVNRPDDALPVLRSVLEEDATRENNKNTFCSDVIEKVKAAVDKSEKKEVQQEFDRILQQLIQMDLIVDSTLDSQLCSEIEKVTPYPPPNQQFSQRMAAAKFSGRERDRSRGFSNAPRRGLMDME
ncbi:pentatricopeptide repeat-containing protein 2, mitochondrial-like [Macrosteles quadrilineatus]|uniref:pentatricopeptide repeat-containing protein 2, mitochondrial-like n=1 Tax=Macrosteles quadrilineatus TaxID=74068 RepID=UPI0023E13F8D|nr:pentatricopeptide repeat-containing protein 2, mitochondrial-like [Macrosteles quadrilineatus]